MSIETDRTGSTRQADAVRDLVREKYAGIALPVAHGGGCGPGCCSSGDGARDVDPVTGDLYGAEEAAAVPGAALAVSLGCGNPTALADLREGEVVLDLGSGGGIDVLLSARRVGPTGFAYGLDMTDEMLQVAERNRAEAGAENVRFLKGHIEAIPLPDASVDVVISNCVINLATDKGQVLREAARVLRPGGRFAVSDVVAQGAVPADLRADMEAWVGCVAGALEEGEYRRLLAAAGLTGVEVEVTREYDPRELAESLTGGDPGSCCGGSAPAWDQTAYARYDAGGGRVVAAFVRAVKPAAGRTTATGDGTEEAPCLACALAGPELAERKAEIGRELFDHVEEVVELEDGFAYRLPSAEGSWPGRALEFVAAERACCPFLAFELVFEPEGGPLWLRLRGPAGVKGFIEAELEGSGMAATRPRGTLDGARAEGDRRGG